MNFFVIGLALLIIISQRLYFDEIEFIKDKQLGIGNSYIITAKSHFQDF